MTLTNANRIFALTLALSVLELGLYVCMLLHLPCGAIGDRVYRTLSNINALRRQMLGIK